MTGKTKSRHGGKRPGAGRKAGIQNKMTREIKSYASTFGKEAVDLLVKIMRDPEAPHSAITAAARELLDRGFGKPAISVDVVGDFAPVDSALLKERYEKNMAKTVEYARLAEERRKMLKEGVLH